MRKINTILLITSLAMAGPASAISFHGEAGEHFTSLSANVGSEDPGLTFGGNWSHNDDQGDTLGLNLGLNIPVGPVLFTVGGKGLYLDPDEGDTGYALAFGGGAQLPLGEHFTVFGESYYSPDSLSSGVDEYVDANAGVKWKILPSMSVEAGYRYINMAGKHGHHDSTLADGAYAAINFTY